MQYTVSVKSGAQCIAKTIIIVTKPYSTYFAAITMASGFLTLNNCVCDLISSETGLMVENYVHYLHIFI